MKGALKLRGKLIILFGIDGSGKSTILDMLKNSNLKNTVYTSCLKNALFEEELYKAEKELHFSHKDIFSHEFKHLLHIGSVVYNMFNNILPLLNSGKNVILDRYTICVKLFTDLFLGSSFACLSNALECLPNPDFGIYFDTDVDTAFQRIERRNTVTGTPSHYSESKESLLRKKAGYEAMIPNEPYRIERINTNQEIEKVYSSILEILNQELLS